MMYLLDRFLRASGALGWPWLLAPRSRSWAALRSRPARRRAPPQRWRWKVADARTGLRPG